MDDGFGNSLGPVQKASTKPRQCAVISEILSVARAVHGLHREPHARDF